MRPALPYFSLLWLSTVCRSSAQWNSISKPQIPKQPSPVKEQGILDIHGVRVKYARDLRLALSAQWNSISKPQIPKQPSPVKVLLDLRKQGILDIHGVRVKYAGDLRLAKSKIPREINDWPSFKTMQSDLSPIILNKATTMIVSLLRRLGCSFLLAFLLCFLNQDEPKITRLCGATFALGFLVLLWAHTIWSTNDKIIRNELKIPTYVEMFQKIESRNIWDVLWTVSEGVAALFA